VRELQRAPRGAGLVAGGVAALARQGRISGIISRALLNRLQRDGVRVRQFTLDPGETVPCAAYQATTWWLPPERQPGRRRRVSLRVTGPNDALFGRIDDIPVPRQPPVVLWATPGAFVRSMPSMQLRLTIARPLASWANTSSSTQGRVGRVQSRQSGRQSRQRGHSWRSFSLPSDHSATRPSALCRLRRFARNGAKNDQPPGRELI
jgi:hypothetical protein